ncbi:putative acyl esterase [Sphingopyxis panaciterrae]|uniref:hypothetical protein n=1 Tax=Sphingopyxis panaciterrae TaxID=363841 RepID=UPI0014223987|nr:hypothetical protein [Sphingopyxis panaciterrae]NIJ36672.1 putative acyl esterase [Sphingopyxis panaciterrae]
MLSFDRPAHAYGRDSYVSDPAKPVPRFIDGRTNVPSDETPVLDAPAHVEDVPVADIIAAATGSDFVVKRVGVYPARYPGTPALGGYLLPIAMDIFRGRYRGSFSTPSAFPANVPQRYRFDLPNLNHMCRPGTGS